MKSILMFLIPKKDVEFIYDDFSLRQTLEKMEFHHYTAIPVLDRNGKYMYSISDGDILFTIKERKLNIKQCEHINVSEVSRYRDTKSIKIDKTMIDLIGLIVNQNFVPVVDDIGSFIGIITRKAVLTYLKEKLLEK